MLALLFAAFFQTASAGTLAGVTMPDTLDASGDKLVLNGLGLREMLFIDIYVAGLYLPTKTHDPSVVINSDVHKRVVMHFIFRRVSPSQIKDTFHEGILNQPGGEKLAAQVAILESYMTENVYAGEEFSVDYTPGVGTTIYAKGVKKGTIPGVDLMKALFSIYVGPKPATEALKQGLLGNGS